MKKIIVFFLFFCFTSQVCFSQEQQRIIDSLLQIYNTTKADTTRINILNDICAQYLSRSDYDNGLKYAFMAQTYGEKVLPSFLKTAQEPVLKKSIALAYNSIGRAYLSKANYAKAMENFQIALKLREEIGDKKGIANAYNNIGIIYNNQANYEKSLENHYKALEIRKELNDKFGIAMSYNNIGIICYQQGNYEKALENHLKSLQLKEEIGDREGASLSYNNIGIIYEKRGDSAKALENYEKYLKVSKEVGNKQSAAYAYNNIGNIYMGRRDFKGALFNQLNSLKIKEELGDSAGIAMSYNNIGSIYDSKNDFVKGLESHLKAFRISQIIGDTLMMSIAYNNAGTMNFKLGNIVEALQYNTKALEWAKKIGYKAGIRESYLALAGVYESKGDFKKAYEYHDQYLEIKSTLLNEESSKQIAEMNIKYDSEKKDKELIKKDAEITRQQTEADRKKLQRNAVVLGFVLILLLSFYIFRGYRLKQTANKQLEEKNDLIESQKKLVEEKNLKITDSITYAMRIQQAILPSDALIKSAFPDSFILFLPKDIVSGDFYWYAEIPETNSKLIVVADCTGHGVPGAFMSMIGNTLLNEIVNIKGIYSPPEILSELNKGIVSSLNQEVDKGITQEDGMDISVVLINNSTKEIEYAAANHFSYLVSSNNLPKQIKGDIYSIGGMFGGLDKKFSSQKIKMDENATLYLFTDGFTDQFGGEKNLKYSTLRFENILSEVSQYNMEMQKELLLQAFESWKKDNKQLDDVLIFGIKF